MVPAAATSMLARTRESCTGPLGVMISAGFCPGVSTKSLPSVTSSVVGRSVSFAGPRIRNVAPASLRIHATPSAPIVTVSPSTSRSRG